MVLWVDKEEADQGRYMFVSNERMQWYGIQLHEVVEDLETIANAKHYFASVAPAWERRRFGPTEGRTILVKITLL